MTMIRFVMACPILLMLSACASSARLEESKTVAVTGDLTRESIGAIVHSTIAHSRDWRVTETPAPNTAHVKLAYKSLDAKAVISWDERTVTFVPRHEKGDGKKGYSFNARRFRNLRDSLLGSIHKALLDESNRVREAGLEPRRAMRLEVLAIGDRIDAAKAKLASYGEPLEEGAVKTPEGMDIGYYLATYDGHPENVGSKYVTLIFFNRAYVAYMLQDKADTELLVFDDYTHKLWEAKKISFRDYVEWKKLKWFEVRNVTADPYDEELFLYQLWQAERVDTRQSTLTEYRFMIKEKDRQIADARANQALVEEQMASAKRSANYQAQMVSLQRQAVDQQRRANISLALLTAFSATYRPTLPRAINCTSYRSFSGYSTTTTCY